MNKIEKFNKFEKIFFKIHLIVFAIGLFLLSLLVFAENALESIAQAFLMVAYLLFYVVIADFIISVVRILKYLIVLRKSDSVVTIRNSVAIMFTSPIALGIYLIVMLAMSISLSSCS